MRFLVDEAALVIEQGIQLHVIALSKSPCHLLDLLKACEIEPLPEGLLTRSVKKVQRVPVLSESDLAEHREVRKRHV